jgi:hypothetical protein
MFRRLLLYCIPLLLASAVASSEEPADEGDKLLPGMSVVGNHESPKSLVIVPWKSSERGDALDVSRMRDDGRQPVDRDVFMRQLDYYQIRATSGRTPGSDAR